jgi:hypothetical protein
MLEQARRLDRNEGRVSFVHRTSPGLACFDNGSFDLVYTDRTPQHLPLEIAGDYL